MHGDYGVCVCVRVHAVRPSVCVYALKLWYECMQTEPAINVRADPDFTASQSSDAAALQQNAEEPSEAHPPEFKSAARQEHMDEAAAIRRQMQVCVFNPPNPAPPPTPFDCLQACFCGRLSSRRVTFAPGQ